MLSAQPGPTHTRPPLVPPLEAIASTTTAVAQRLPPTTRELSAPNTSTAGAKPQLRPVRLCIGTKVFGTWMPRTKEV